MIASLRAATAAPSIHNTQPWLFRVDGPRIEVLFDQRRHLTVIDPERRAMHLSVGAALLNLRVAILDRGRAVGVELLAGGEPGLAARVTVGASRPVDPATRELAGAISRRRTGRRPFPPRPVPDSILAECVAAALGEDALLVMVDPTAAYDVLELTRAAERQQLADPRCRAELAAWAATPPSPTDGVSAAAPAPRPEPATRQPRDLEPARARRTAGIEREPTIGVLYSRGDEPADWLRAGQALQHVLLTATARGVATSLMMQATEVPPLRAELAAKGEPHWAQAVIRLGYGRPAPRTPRRPLSEVLLPR
jgi:nitroreductase